MECADALILYQAKMGGLKGDSVVLADSIKS